MDYFVQTENNNESSIPGRSLSDKNNRSNILSKSLSTLSEEISRKSKNTAKGASGDEMNRNGK